FAPGETSAWIAPPGKLKSALIGEASFAIASDLPDWHGYRVKRSGAVIYFALERVSLVERPLLAYQAQATEESANPPTPSFPAFGRPDVSGAHIPEAKWHSATITTPRERQVPYS